MAPLVYLLCCATALVCTVLLLRGYFRARARLLLWSGLCFACLTLNNGLIAVDLLVFPQINLFPLRNFTALLGVCLLLYGLIWESK